jgi:hypothetical protein
MTPSQPPALTLVEYRVWLKKEFDYASDESSRNYYKVVVDRIHEVVRTSDFWALLLRELQEAHDTYFRDSGGYPLLTNLRPELVTKGYDAFFLKTYRWNVLNNPAFPAPPPDYGWTEPTNWYGRVTDLVRTLLVVKYLDGVKFLTERLADFCEARGVLYGVALQARTEGYYAGHFRVRQVVEVVSQNDWKTMTIEPSVEIQVSTQLQEVMRQTLHKFYETNRSLPEQDPIAWQWDYASPEFSANYLGHILHYVEGKIMEIRDAQKVGSR